jgi:hypothetical protein
VRVVLEEAGGGGDVGGLDDQKSGDLNLGTLMRLLSR